MNAYSTGKAAEYLGVTVKTLQRWDREGRLRAERTDKGRRMYSRASLDAFMRRTPKVVRSPVAYCRVSSAAQKPDLKNQRRVLEDFCAARGVANVEYVEEVGGGLNMRRKRFLSVMDRIEAGQVSHLIIAHKDRLVRFGFSPEQKMVQDLMTIVHCFSARLYGLRSYRKKLDEASKADLK
jgi:putative resolvase